MIKSRPGLKKWLIGALVFIVIVLVIVAISLIAKHFKKEQSEPFINLLTKERFMGKDSIGNNDPLAAYIDTWIDAEIGEAK